MIIGNNEYRVAFPRLLMRTKLFNLTPPAFNELYILTNSILAEVPRLFEKRLKRHFYLQAEKYNDFESLVNITLTSYEFYKFELFEEAKQSFTKKKILHEDIIKGEIYKNKRFWEACLGKYLEGKLVDAETTRSPSVDLAKSRRYLVSSELNVSVRKMLNCGIDKIMIEEIVDYFSKKYSLKEEDKQEIMVGPYFIKAIID